MSEESDFNWFIEESANHADGVNVSYANYTGPYQQIISDRLMWHLNLFVNVLLCEVVAIFGITNNVVNMIVFVRLGLKDSMTVCLFNLALSDFLLCFIVFVSRAFTVWDTFFETDIIDPMAIWYVGFGRVADSIFVCSGWITTFLALERCVCVIFPFKVKTVFTRNRSILIVTAIYVAVISTYIPLFATHYLGWITLELKTINGTATKKRLVVLFSDNRAKVEAVLEILTGSVLTFPSVAIILGSMGWMTYGLRVSSEKRSAMTAHTTAEAGADRPESRLNSKTRRLVKVVMFLAIIFTLCSLPRFYAKYMHQFMPEMDEGGREVNLILFIWQFVRFASVVNASVNIFVYWSVNSSYRAQCRQLFSYGKQGKE